MPEQPQSPTQYPIQPTFINVREIHFVAHRPPSADDRIQASRISITQFVSPLVEATRRVQVTLTAEFGSEQDLKGNTPPPFSVKVSVTGEFVIDAAFPNDKIPLWVSRNAGFVIYPYLRERLYYITSQGGYPPILLPLLQIPTIKLEVSKPPASAPTAG